MGYTFVFENKSSTTTLDEYMTFDKFENLKLTSADAAVSDGKPFWKFTVEPNKKIVKHLRRVSVDLGFSISFSASHEFLKPCEKLYSVKEKTKTSVSISKEARWSKYEILYFPHKGIYYSHLFIKDHFYSSDTKSPFFPSKIFF